MSKAGLAKKRFKAGLKVKSLINSGWVRKGDILEVSETTFVDGSDYGYPDKKTDFIKCCHHNQDLNFRPEELEVIEETKLPRTPN